MAASGLAAVRLKTSAVPVELKAKLQGLEVPDGHGAGARAAAFLTDGGGGRGGGEGEALPEEALGRPRASATARRATRALVPAAMGGD